MYETEKQIVYENSDFDEDIARLVAMLKEDKNQPRLFPRFNGIYGISMGADVLVSYLHYRLKLPALKAPTPNSLLVDDIIDSGDTMSHYAKKGYFIVSLFCNPRKSIVKPNIWLHEKLEKWIHFPWEAPEDGDDRLER